MKNILCAVMALFLTLPAFAKLNAYQEARINAMLDALGQKKDLIFRTQWRCPYLRGSSVTSAVKTW